MWRNYVPSAYIQSAYLMLLLLSVVNEQFKLGIENELEAIAKLVNEQKARQLDAKLKEIGGKQQSR